MGPAELCGYHDGPSWRMIVWMVVCSRRWPASSIDRTITNIGFWSRVWLTTNVRQVMGRVKCWRTTVPYRDLSRSSCRTRTCWTAEWRWTGISCSALRWCEPWAQSLASSDLGQVHCSVVAATFLVSVVVFPPRDYVKFLSPWVKCWLYLECCVQHKAVVVDTWESFRGAI